MNWLGLDLERTGTSCCKWCDEVGETILGCFGGNSSGVGRAVS